MATKPPPKTGRDDTGMTARQAYNIATDLGGGPNVRLKDNLYQAVAILVCLVLGVVIGLVLASDKIAGAVVGAFVGLVVGLLGSGIVLMVYRLVMHASGRHD